MGEFGNLNNNAYICTNMKKEIILLRGLPGGGKSTFAHLLGDAICTADDFHMIDGEYCWKPSNVKKSHLLCQQKANNYMMEGTSPVIIANTSTTEKELKPYYDLAEKWGYRVFSIIVENRHGGVNDHSVPEETLEKMKTRFNIKL